MLQDWDRIAMLVVGGLVSLPAGWDGWRFWRKRNYLAVVGILILILAAVGTPLALVLFAT